MTPLYSSAASDVYKRKISKSGQIGEVYAINGLLVALPKIPKLSYSRSKKKEEQYWEAMEYSKELSRIKNGLFFHQEKLQSFMI